MKVKVNNKISGGTKIRKIFLKITILLITCFSILSICNNYYSPARLNAESEGADIDLIKKEKEETQKKIEEAQKEQDAYAAQVEQV